MTSRLIDKTKMDSKKNKNVDHEMRLAKKARNLQRATLKTKKT